MDNLDNIYKISFCLRDRNTEILKIYQESSLHYLAQQTFKKQKNDFYLILAQVLNLDESGYEMYAARPKLGKKEQRCFVVPVVLHNREGPIRQRSKFQMWNEWNFAETQNYLVLYWPQQFDHAEYYLSKLVKKKYEARLTDLIFVCHKNVDYGPRA
jgi:hypothetical protein